jgi:formate dehydrogenase major subunit
MPGARCRFRADADVALLNALIHTVIEEGLVNEEFVRTRASNFDALKRNVQGYSAEAMAPICGIPAETIREVAREFARAEGGHGAVGHGHQPARARPPTTPAASLRWSASPARSASPVAGCTRCVARTTCKAPATQG